MSFNPDEYLKEEFNPDQYLASFNPDEYLSGTPTTSPSLVNQIPGLEQSVDTSTNSTVTQYKEALAKDIAKYGPQGVLGGPIDATLGLGSGMVAPIAGAMQVINNPISNLLFDSKLPVGEQAYAQGMESATWTPKSAVGEKIQGDIIDPAMQNLIAVAPMLTHPVLSKKMESKIKSIKEPVVEPTPEMKLTNPKLAQEHFIPLVKAELDNITEKVQALHDEGNWTKENVDTLSALEEYQTKLQLKLNELEGIANGESKEAIMNRAVKLREKIEEIQAQRERRGQRVSPYPDEPTSIERATDTALSRPEPEALPTPQEIVEQARREPTTSPTQVALEKIGEAKDMTTGELADHILNTEDRLNAIEDIPENSSVRENIKQELKAYEDIQQGREPDLSWFEGKQESPTLEGIHVEELTPDVETTIASPKVTFDTPADIYHYEGNTLQHLADNSQMFNRREGSQIFFDKRFRDSVFGKMAEKVIGHFLDVTGLSKDHIYISFDEGLGTSGGRVSHIGDTSHIRLNPKSFEKLVSGKGVDYGFLKGKALENAKTAYAAVRIAAHEIGHVVLNKYLRTFTDNYKEFDYLVKDFTDYKSKNNLENVSGVDFWKGETSAKAYREAQSYFHEYFAERTAKELLGKHALGAFSKGRGKTMQALLDASTRILEKHGVKVDKPAFYDDVISQLLSDNISNIKASGETLWETLDRHRNDLILEGKAHAGEFTKMSLQDIVSDPKVVTIRKIKNKDVNPFMGLDLNDIPTMSTRLLDALGRGIQVLGREFHNRNNLVDMNPKDRTLATLHSQMREHDLYAEGVVNRLWYGDYKPQETKWFNVFSKVKDAASTYMAVKMSSALDKAVLHDLFKKGFEEKLNYEDNLLKNGQHLNEKQKKFYKTLSDTFTKMYDESAKIEDKLGKKNIISKRDGWYPSARVGKYSVSINYGDLVGHVQQFSTLLQAEKFRERLLRQDISEFQVSEVIDLTKQDSIISNMEIAQDVVNVFSNLFPSAKRMLDEKAQKLLESYATRGGKLGKHHDYRQNISGYKGSEFWKSREELGTSFGEAIEQAISEKGMQIKEMLYKHHIGPILEDPWFKENKPNSSKALQQMYDSALGRNKELTSDLDNVITHKVDQVADEILRIFGSEKTSDKSIKQMTKENIQQSFALMYMLPKAVFAIIGQQLSVPAMTISKMSYGGHGLKAYESFAKGTFKLVTGNKELLDALKKVSQETNTFEPQFMETLSLYKESNKIVQGLKDYALLQAPGKVSESLSRVISFSVFYEHYKSLGMSEERAIQEAIVKTGDSLNLYDKANRAPIFAHLGTLGELIQPLTGYGQNKLGNVIGMIRYLDTMKPSTWSPLINFTLLTMATSGILALPFVTEYEQIRRKLNEWGDFSLPSILDVVMGNDGINRIVPLPQAMRESVMLGVTSQTGIDLSVSDRSSQSFPTLLLGVILGNEAPGNIMPVYQWAAKIPGAIGTMGKGIAGDAKSADIKEALDVLAPAGHVGYGIKEAAGVNNTTVFGDQTDQMMIGKSGEAGEQRQTIDKVAGMLGSKSTKNRLLEMEEYEQQQNEKILTKKIDDTAIKFAETGDKKFLDQLVKLGASDKQILNKVNLELYNRLVPLNTRMVFNKNGKMVAGRGTRAAIGMSQFQK